MHKEFRVLRCVLVIALVAGILALAPVSVHAQSATDFVPVTDAILKEPSPDDWLMWRRTLRRGG